MHGMKDDNLRLGDLLAQALAGAWRPSPPPLRLSSRDLASVASLLLETGAGALAWWRLRNTQLRSCSAAEQLQQAYRLHTLQAAIHERSIAHVTTVMRSAGLDPILAKGWAATRYYAQPGLRPFADIDLLVPPEDYGTAREVLSGVTEWRPAVDLHKEFIDLKDRTIGELYRRSELITVENAEVRILGPEDHLRLVCLHQLRHGAWRPLWLCDVAAAVESATEDFDWSYALSGNQRLSAWVICVIGLAHQLLGARLDSFPYQVETLRVPERIISSVLKAWGCGHPDYSSDRPMNTYLRNPRGILKAIHLRWQGPLEAGIRWQSPYSRLPAVTIQLGDFSWRTARYAVRLGRAE